MQQKEEFIKIIKANEGIIYKVTRAYTNDTDDQKDLYQEIVYQLWKSFETFKGLSKISTWMYRVALNTSILHLNKKKRRPDRVSDFELPQIVDDSSTYLEDQVSELYDQIKQLSIVERGIILLYLEGKSYNEIAAVTGFSTTNIGTRLGRIKQKLRTNIKNQ